MLNPNEVGRDKKGDELVVKGVSSSEAESAPRSFVTEMVCQFEVSEKLV